MGANNRLREEGESLSLHPSGTAPGIVFSAKKWKILYLYMHWGWALYAPPLLWFALYSKNLNATHVWKVLTHPNFLLRMPLY